MFCLNWMLLSFTVTLLKYSYNDPRPFWLNSEILPLSCSANYGNPSGHTTQAFGNTFFLWLVYRERVTSLWSKLGFALGVWTLALLEAYARVISGVHSWDQVLFSAMLGIWVATFSYFLFKAYLHHHLLRVGKAAVKSKFVFRCIFLSVFGIVILAGTQLFVFSYKETVMLGFPQEWLQNIMAHCPGFDLNEEYQH